MLCATYGVKLGNYDSYLMSCDQAQASAIADAVVSEAEGTEAAKAAKTVKDGLWTDYLAISAQYYGLCAIVNDYYYSDDPDSEYT